MNKAETRAALEAAGLTDLAKSIDQIARNSIRITATPGDESNLPIGASKLGGSPDLPAGTAWPEWKGQPQSFIAQIHLEELWQYDLDKVLPQSGMLWFFYDAKQETFGESPDDRGGWQLIYKPGETGELKRTAFPDKLPAEARFKPCSVKFASELTLPQDPQPDLPGMKWSDEQQEKYEGVLAKFPGPNDHAGTHHRLLGNPDTLQDDMRSQCQLVTNGITDSSDPKAEDLLKKANDWLLLLQVDTDDHAGMKWASTGMLYYWVKAEDLKQQRFDATWLVLQSE